jgi:transposase
VGHGKRFSTGKVCINGLEGFWSYAKERLIKHHGVSKDKFTLCLKEMEFRYNNRKY